MKRLDIAVARMLGCSRAYAKTLIEDGGVTLNGVAATKPSHPVPPGVMPVCGAAGPRYVSRGGHKLAHALDVFAINVTGCVCLDVGASTGGFTHCLLRRGAVKVYAVDTGTAQLAPLLRDDARVVSRERTNINDVRIDDDIQFACVDVSFVSVTKVMAAVFALLSPKGKAVFLIKPQFEAGRAHIGKRGLVKDRRVHARVLAEVEAAARGMGRVPRGCVASPIAGGTGNMEYLMYFNPGDTQCGK